MLNFLLSVFNERLLLELAIMLLDKLQEELELKHEELLNKNSKEI